jgi:hypothetical protein
MGRRRQFAKTLALAAAGMFLLQPVICDVLHTVEDRLEAAEHPLGPDQPASGEVPDGLASHVPAIEEAHHCCGGHDRPPVTLKSKLTRTAPNAEAKALGKPISLSLTLSRLPSALCRFGPLIAASPASQGILRALLCRWLI